MGQRRNSGGVKPHGAGIQLTIYYRGERLRPTLPIAPTVPNLRHAERVLDEIRARIRTGTFEPGDYFPEYKYLSRVGGTRVHTFDHYADAYLAAGRARLSPSTLDVYRKILSSFWRLHFAGRNIDTIRHSEIAAIMGATPWRSLKTHNNWLSCLRRVFALAVADGIKLDPTAGIEFAKPQRVEPDPFTLPEVDAILDHMRRRDAAGAQFADYFEAAFFEGFRPSEQIATLWPDVDTKAGLVIIRRARVVGVDKERTKTSTAREVELTARGLAAFKRQAARSRLAGAHVWLGPRTGKPYTDEQVQYNEWGSTLRALGIRYRVPYQTRHTCATLMLMAGANPAWAARKLGHSVEMFFRIYSRWLPGADRGRELAKVEAFLNQSATKTATS